MKSRYLSIIIILILMITIAYSIPLNSTIAESNTSENIDYYNCQEFYDENNLYIDKSIDQSSFCSENIGIKDPFESFIYKDIAKKETLSITADVQPLAFCQTCNVNSYETSESNCPACGNYEECKDIYIKSTVYAADTSACLMSCDQQTGTDECKDDFTVKEAYLDCYCCDEVFFDEISCGDGYYCNDGACRSCSGVCDNNCQSAACFNTDPDCDSSGNPNSVCCGDNECEAGETFSNCPNDCYPDIRVVPSSLNFVINK